MRPGNTPCMLPTSPARFRSLESSRRASARFTTLCWERNTPPWPHFNRANPRSHAMARARFTKWRTTTSIPTARILHGQPLGQYFIHGLSHYIGLNVHDPGDYGVPLGPGAAFTIEPGIYIPEEKLGVRIEDDFYVDTTASWLTSRLRCRVLPTKLRRPWPRANGPFLFGASAVVWYPMAPCGCCGGS